MIVNFDCLEQDMSDRTDLMYCLNKIKEDFSAKLYVETDDICIFLKKIKPVLYRFLEDLGEYNDTVGQSIVVEYVIETIMVIYNKIEHKEDILDEFNTINHLLGQYNPSSTIRMNLEILKKITEQCKIYFDRPIEEIREMRRKEGQNITREDYQFLLDM